MGCCVSSGIQSEENGLLGPRSPPPVEEETVKEVLSETRIVHKVEDGGVKGSTLPAWKMDSAPPTVSPAVGHNAPRRVITQERKVSVEEKKEKSSGENEIVSESSELFSYSESSWNAPPPVEKKDIEGEGGVVDQRPPVRKPRAPTPTRTNVNGNGERVHGRKPAVSSPERRTPIAPQRSCRGRMAAEQTRTVAEERIHGRDPRERSVRRSRTPVRRIDSPARRNLTDEKSVAVTSDAVLAGEESLENPVVSLECFIFL